MSRCAAISSVIFAALGKLFQHAAVNPKNLRDRSLELPKMSGNHADHQLH